MDWGSFIPAVIMGLSAGLLFALTRYWKSETMKARALMDVERHHRMQLEDRLALVENVLQQTQQLVQKQQVKFQVPTGQFNDFESLKELFVKYGDGRFKADEKQFVIQEEL